MAWRPDRCDGRELTCSTRTRTASRSCGEPRGHEGTVASRGDSARLGLFSARAQITNGAERRTVPDVDLRGLRCFAPESNTPAQVAMGVRARGTPVNKRDGEIDIRPVQHRRAGPGGLGGAGISEQ